MKRLLLLITVAVAICSAARLNAQNMEYKNMFPRGEEFKSPYFTGKVWLEMLSDKDGQFNCPHARFHPRNQRRAYGSRRETAPRKPSFTRKIKERDEDLRPAIKNKLADLDKYSVVFIGAPIWYGGPLKIVETFYEASPNNPIM